MSTLNISDPEPAIRNEQAQNQTSKRNKILLGVGLGTLVLGGAAAAIVLTVGKSSGTTTNTKSDAQAPPGGDENGFTGTYGTGFLMPPNANEIVNQLPPFSAAAPLVAALGASVDWRTNANVVTPVRNQGGCGSCWAFSAIADMEASYGRKYNKAIDLSQQQLVDCDLKDGGCNGGWMMTAWTQYFKNNQQPYSLTNSMYPYAMMSPNGKQRNTCTANGALGPVVVTNTQNIIGTQTWSIQAEETVMGYLAQNGPAAIAVNADGWGNYKGGIATTASLRCTQALTHAVNLVGYGEENGQKYWIIRNSWSASWGEKGYIRLARGANTCCVLCAVMGVTVAQTGNAAPTGNPQPPPSSPTKIAAGQQLSAGQQISSPDGNIIFKMQTDGNLVLYKTIFAAINSLQAVWATNTFGANFVVKMQPDCNLVAYNGNGQAVWASGSNRANDAACAQSSFQVNNDATASIVKSGGVIWATNGATPTTTRPPVAPTTTKPPVTNSPVTTKAPAKSLSVVNLGCWADNAARQLPTRLSGASNAIMRDCAWLAYNQGKTFFGLQYGGECYGGNTDPRALGQSTQCNMKCQGNPSETCGGSWANTVYQIVATSALPPSAPAVEFNPPPQNFNIDTDCKFFAGAPSYCWRCIDNINNKVVCRDATVSDLSRDLELNVADDVAESLCPEGRKEFAAEICGKGNSLSNFNF